MSKKQIFTVETLQAALASAGDAVVDYINSNGKQRYQVVTTEIAAANSPYVLAKLHEYCDKRGNSVELVNEQGILAFSWDADKFVRVLPSSVTNVTPLSTVLKNA